MRVSDFNQYLAHKPESDPKYLNSEGKKILLNDYFRFMEQKSYLAGKRIKNKDHIHYLSGELVKTLKNFNIHDTEAYHL